MNKKNVLLGLLLTGAMPVFAGGFLTNTNQSSLFLRNTAIDAYMKSIESAYHNPAGTAFLNKGFHLSISLQNARQERIITSTFAPFMGGINNNRNAEKVFKGKAYAPVIPSFQAGYNVGDLAISASFGIIGGGGKCEFSDGLASFESAASMLPVLGAEQLGINSYSINTYMRGRQYYYGFQLGAAYKLKQNFSVYGGMRVVYATTNYYGYVKDISVGINGGNTQLATSYFDGVFQQAVGAAQQYKGGAEQAAAAAQQAAAAAQQFQAAGDLVNAAQYAEMAQQYKGQAEQYAAAAQQYADKAVEMKTLSVATEDVTLNCDQNGWGFTPIVGVDWKISDKLNLAAKYEFRTRMQLKNTASSSESANNLAQLDQFRDGKKVDEDIPSLLTVGVQFTPVERLRLSAGYHYYNDKGAKKYGDSQKLLSGGTKEILAGAEYDINKTLTVSAGWQKTNYGLTDAYMKDLSFVTNSNSVGGGFRIKLAEKCHLDLCYFQTFYSNYDKTSADYNGVSSLARLVLGDQRTNELLSNISTSPFAGKDSFTRKNRVISASVSFDF